MKSNPSCMPPCVSRSKIQPMNSPSFYLNSTHAFAKESTAKCTNWRRKRLASSRRKPTRTSLNGFVHFWRLSSWSQTCPSTGNKKRFKPSTSLSREKQPTCCLATKTLHLWPSVQVKHLVWSISCSGWWRRMMIQRRTKIAIQNKSWCDTNSHVTRKKIQSSCSSAWRTSSVWSSSIKRSTRSFSMIKTCSSKEPWSRKPKRSII